MCCLGVEIWIYLHGLCARRSCLTVVTFTAQNNQLKHRPFSFLTQETKMHLMGWNSNICCQCNLAYLRNCHKLVLLTLMEPVISRFELFGLKNLKKVLFKGAIILCHFNFSVTLNHSIVLKHLYSLFILWLLLPPLAFPSCMMHLLISRLPNLLEIMKTKCHSPCLHEDLTAGFGPGVSVPTHLPSAALIQMSRQGWIILRLNQLFHLVSIRF